MHFLGTARSLSEPLELDEALCRALWGRASADTLLFENAAGEAMVRLPWRSEEEARQKVAEHALAAIAVHDQLSQGNLRTYIEHPSNGWLRVPREYWFTQEIAGRHILEAVDGATGFDEGMQGRPILVASEDLPEWEHVVRAAVAKLGPTEEATSPRAVRYRTPSQKRAALERFLTWVDGQQNPTFPQTGKPFFLAYSAWCRKHSHSPYGRSTFYEELKKIRS